MGPTGEVLSCKTSTSNHKVAEASTDVNNELVESVIIPILDAE